MKQVTIKKQSKESKVLCEQMTGQCAFAKPAQTAIDAFKRKPYYIDNINRKG